MTTNARQGYPAKWVAEFLDHHTEERTLKVIGHEPHEHEFLGDRRLTIEDKRTIERWRESDGLAPLAVVDRILIYYDFALWEYEQWAHNTHGTNSFVDRDAPEETPWWPLADLTAAE